MDAAELPQHTLQIENMNRGRVDIRVRNRFAGTMDVVQVDLGDFNRALALGKQGVEVPVEILHIS